MKRILLTAMLFLSLKALGIDREIGPQPDTDTTEEAMKNIIQFIAMEKGHVARWLEFDKYVNDGKYTLLIKHHNEIADLKMQGMPKMLAMINKGDDANWERFLRIGLQKMMQLRTKQVEEWKRMSMGQHKEAKDIYLLNQSEFNEFKKSVQ